MKVYNVIMAGGGGTRFWPLSRQEVPKQLINLSGEDALINETINRIDSLAKKDDLFIV
ncbi:mannose-1-phosphate guanylyltransferase, partial [Clostridioides difficile]|nr:mannose-1-phosphate guanylyltransferase [Clostridioides difficile]